MWSLSSPGGAALRESDFDFERVLLGLCWDRASWAPAPNKAAGLSTVPRGPCPHRPLPDLTPLLPVPMTPPQPALQWWMPRAGGVECGLLGSGQSWFRAQPGVSTEDWLYRKGVRQGAASVSGESVYPSCWARTRVPCSHAFCWCVSDFLVDLFLLAGKQIAP